MKEAFKKIEDLAKELNGSAKPGIGGGYIIIASENSNDDDASTLSVMNGQGFSILTMLTRAFINSPDLRELAKAAIIAADALEARARRAEKHKLFKEDAEGETTCDSGETTDDAEGETTCAGKTTDKE